MISKREKASRTYRDSSENGVEIFGRTHGSGATVIFQFTASSSPAKRAVVESSVRRHRYNYRDNSDAEYGGGNFSPLHRLTNMTRILEMLKL